LELYNNVTGRITLIDEMFDHLIKNYRSVCIFNKKYIRFKTTTIYNDYGNMIIQ